MTDPVRHTPAECREAREDARSAVRRRLSYAAGTYAFGGGIALVGAALFVPEAKETVTFAKDVYLSILPTAAGVIGYWFATRSEDRQREE